MQLAQLRNKITILLIALLAFGLLAQEDNEQQNADSLNPADTILQVPAYIRGIFTFHLPVTTFEIGAEKTESVWFPMAEMGFSITPTMVWDDYFLEFPLRVKTIPPFLDKYAAIGDISAAAYFRTYRNWGLGMEYRYARAKYYPGGVLLDGHIWTLDLGVPFETLWLKGLKLEWLAAGKIEWWGDTERDIIKFSGTAFMISPYWTFELEQGDIEIIFRTMVNADFSGYRNRGRGPLYQASTPSISEFEIHYTYP